MLPPLTMISWSPGPPEMIIAGFVVLTTGPAGFHPSWRQPLPGSQKLCVGVRFLSSAVIGIKAKKEWDGKNRKGDQNPELSVSN